MQASFDYPPYPYLFQVVEHCPKSAATYMNIWKSRDKHNHLSIAKEEIRSEYLSTPTKFKNDLVNLVREGLISIKETPLRYTIELVGYDENFDQFGDQLEV